jgi:hypothetical protein
VALDEEQSAGVRVLFPIAAECHPVPAVSDTISAGGRESLPPRPIAGK